jgi:hypothetical protein
MFHSKTGNENSKVKLVHLKLNVRTLVSQLALQFDENSAHSQSTIKNEKKNNNQFYPSQRKIKDLIKQKNKYDNYQRVNIEFNHFQIYP